ncbi:MAG: DUF4143 domain-containing protein [Treponema sp.]|nr:DUF4143 domain-containing protein [Treponema sp.]
MYVADSGITAALLGLRSFSEMSGHPSFGAVWEQIVLSNLRGWLPGAEICHYRTANGAEADFVVRAGGKNVFAGPQRAYKIRAASGIKHRDCRVGLENAGVPRIEIIVDVEGTIPG